MNFDECLNIINSVISKRDENVFLNSVQHGHHILPKHFGGKDEKNNIIKLTIDEHAEVHRLMFEKYNLKEDWLAYAGLSKMIGKEEIIIELCRIQGKINGKKTKIEKKGIHSDKYLKSENRIIDCKNGGIIAGNINKNKEGFLKEISFKGYEGIIKKYGCKLNNENREKLGLNKINPYINFSEKEIFEEKERLRKNSQNRKGSSWYYNPKNESEQRMINLDNGEKIPEGWLKGRKIQKNKGKTFWFNKENNIEKFTYECPGEGFIKGRNPIYSKGNIKNLKQFNHGNKNRQNN